MTIIGIAGGTGSGKTTVVRKIMEDLAEGQVALIPQDSYYNRKPEDVPFEIFRQSNFDHPDAFDWELLGRHIRTLREGRAIEQPVYSMLTCDREASTIRVEPADVIIIEGIMALYKKELRDMMDLKIFVDADSDERLIRVIERDVVERGRTARIVIDRYLHTLKPMHQEFIEPTKAYADLIIPQGGENKCAIRLMRRYIRQLLTEKQE
ncbi:MAG: uridine kinase [Prevotellaceae bacterium]|nr:uridine kinase [Prevotellaceae bacterium]